VFGDYWCTGQDSEDSKNSHAINGLELERPSRYLILAFLNLGSFCLAFVAACVFVCCSLETWKGEGILHGGKKEVKTLAS